MDEEITPLDFAKYRLKRAKEDLEAAQLLYNNNSLLAANNRAYYAIFRAIRAVLALERVDFKRHKDVIGYFNHHYIKPEIFPRTISRKITQAQRIREDSDYDDEYEPSHEKTEQQINTAKELIELVEEYIHKNNK